MDRQAGKAWVRPELIVLVRSGPEEAVLDTCKTAGAAPGALTQAGCLDNQTKTPFRCVPYVCFDSRPS